MEVEKVKDELDDLEFSTRTTNCLRIAGWTTRDKIAKLGRNDVLAMPNAGRKTWNEIAEWQNHFKRPRYEMTDLVIAIRKVNEIMQYLSTDTSKPPARLVTNGSEVTLWVYVE